MTQALIDYAEELETAEEGSGVAYLRALRGRCLESLNSGSVTEFISTTVNGQTFSAQVQVNAPTLLEYVNAALRNVQGNDVRITYPTFSGIPH